MELSTREVEGTLVLRVSGRLDTATAPEFDAECAGKAAAGTRRIVVDLTDLEYISSAGLRSVLALAKRLQAAEGDLRLCGARGLVQEILAASGFADLLPVFPTVEAALGQAS